jgi:hypothetical protein
MSETKLMLGDNCDLSNEWYKFSKEKGKVSYIIEPSEHHPCHFGEKDTMLKMVPTIVYEDEVKKASTGLFRIVGVNFTDNGDIHTGSLKLVSMADAGLFRIFRINFTDNGDIHTDQISIMNI